jgi:hypothetical protein
VNRPPATKPVITLVAGRLGAILVLTLLLPVTGLLAGCGAAGPPVRHATTDTCFAFGVRALERHQTVTRLPRACAGLSREQVNAAVGRALRDVVGPLAKAPFRSRAIAESRYLANLVQSVPTARQSSAPRAAPVPSAAGLPTTLTALACWIITAAAGMYLLAGWLTRTRSGRRRFRAAGMPPAVIGGHASLGLAGLGIWIAFMTTAEQAFGWIAVGTTFLVAGLGMATLLTATPETQRAGRPVPEALSSGTAIASTMTASRAPVLVIALHGVLATITILLVLLAAIGSG